MTEEKLKFPQSFPLLFLLCGNFMVVTFFFFSVSLAVIFSSLCFLLGRRVGHSPGDFFEFSAFSLTNENCSKQTSQIILQ